MSVFDKVLQPAKLPESLVLSPPEAMAAVLIAATNSDGYMSREEGERLNQLFGSMKLYRPHSAETFQPIITKVMELIRLYGPAPVVKMGAQAIDPELRATTFALATDLVLADGRVGAEEKQFIDELQAALDIPEDLAVKIVEVMIVKNRA